MVVLLILSLGYIAYDKFVVQKDLDKEIADLKEKIISLSNSNSVSNDNSCPK